MVLVDLKGEHDFDCKNITLGDPWKRSQKKILIEVDAAEGVTLTCKGELDTALF